MKNSLVLPCFTVLAMAAAMTAARAADIPAAPLIEGEAAESAVLAAPTWEHTLAHFKLKWSLSDDSLVQIKSLLVEQMDELTELRQDGMLTDDARKVREQDIMQATRQKILHVVLVSVLKNKGALQGIGDTDWQHTRSRGPW